MNLGAWEVTTLRGSEWKRY